MQPIIADPLGIKRFHSNAIVEHLLEFAQLNGHGLNELACLKFSPNDREQFAQLIGYSVSGFGELNYASRDTIDTADRISDTAEPEHVARSAVLEEKLSEIREHLRNAAAVAFSIHPSDLTA